jgi:hypothetical protein
MTSENTKHDSSASAVTGPKTPSLARQGLIWSTTAIGGVLAFGLGFWLLSPSRTANPPVTPREEPRASPRAEQKPVNQQKPVPQEKKPELALASIPWKREASTLVPIAISPASLPWLRVELHPVNVDPAQLSWVREERTYQPVYADMASLPWTIRR